MTQYDKHLRAENVDEQIERPQDFLADGDIKLVVDLHTRYQALAELNAHSLDTAWARIKQLQGQTLPHEEVHTRDHIVLVENDTLQIERTKHMQDTVAAKNKRWKLLKHQLTLWVAVLLVAIIVGSTGIVLSIASHKGKGTTTSQVTLATSSTNVTYVAPVPGIYISSEENQIENFAIDRLDQTSHAVLWKRIVGNISRYASIVVVGNTVYVCADDDTHEYLYALNATDGSLNWRANLGPKYIQVTQSVHVPTSEDAVTSSIPGSSGPPARLEELGYLTTPTVADGLVYLAQATGKVYALNAQTGTTSWTYDTKVTGLINWTLYYPGNLAVANGMVYGSIHNKLFALDAKQGGLRWMKQVDPIQVLDSPKVIDRTLYTSSSALDTHQLGTARDSFVYSYATKDGKQNWLHPLTSWVQDLTIVAGRLYFGTFDYNVYALRATDGIEVWHQNIKGHVRKVLIASGVLYAQEDGNYGPTQLTSTVDAALFAFRAADGTQLWSQKTTAYVSLETVANGVLYATDFPRQLTAFSATTGAELWHQLYGTDLIDKMGGHSGRVTAITVVS